jgi:hypothetical protein
MAYFLTLISFAAFIAAFIVTLIHLWNWFLPWNDQTCRKYIDDIINKLEKMCLSTLLAEIIASIVKKLKQIEDKKLIFLSSLFLLNLIAAWIALAAPILLNFDQIEDSLVAVFEVITAEPYLLTAAALVICVTGICIELFSYRITLLTLEKIEANASSKQLALIILANLAIVASACMVVYFILAIILKFAFPEIVNLVEYYSFGLTRYYISPSILETLKVNSAVWISICALGLGAAIPSAASVLIAAAFIFLKSLSPSLQNFIKRSLLALKTNGAPMINQVSSFFANLAGLFSFFFTALSSL